MVQQWKNSTCNLRDVCSIPVSGRSPGEGNGNPLQSSYLGNPMDRKASWTTVRGVTKIQTWVSKHTCMLLYTWQICKEIRFRVIQDWRCINPNGYITLKSVSSVAQSCPTLCDSIDCSMPGFPVHHQLPELAQTHVHRQWCHPTISSSVIPFSSCLQPFPASGSFQMSQFLLEFQLQHQSFQIRDTKCSFGISNFLKEISSLSNSVVFLCFFALFA